MNEDQDDRLASQRWLIVQILLGAMVSVPFLTPVKLPPIASFQAEILAAALGLAATTCAVVFLRRSALPLPRLNIIPLLFCVLIAAQILMGHVPSVQPSLIGALYLLWAAGLLFTGAALRSALGMTRVVIALAWCIMLGAVLSALAGLAQMFGSEMLATWVSPTSGGVWGNLGQRNHFADYIALGLCSALFLWAQRKIRAPTFFLCAGLMAAIAPMSGSRSIWLYGGCFLVTAALWFYRDRSASNARLLWCAVLLLPTMFIIGMLWSAIGTEELSLPTSLQRLHVASVEERPSIWQAAWFMIRQSPVFGVGFGQFGWNFFVLNPSLHTPVPGFTNNAHNLILHVGAEMGMLGLAVLLAGFYLWIRGVRKLASTPAAWWVLSITGVLGVHAMLEFPLWYSYFLGVLALVLGLTEGGKLEFAPSRLLRGLLVVALALGWFVGVQLFREYAFLEDFLVARGRYIEATGQVSDTAMKRLLTIRRQSLLAPLVELGLARSIQLNRDELRAKLVINERALRNFPVDDVAYRQAILLAMDGQVEAANRQWDLALKAYPERALEISTMLRTRAEQLGGAVTTLREYAEKSTRRN